MSILVRWVRTMRRNIRGRPTRRRGRYLCYAIICLITWFLTLGMASHASTPEEGMVAVDLENVDLRVLIKFVSEVTGRMFLLDDRVRGQVSVRFANKIPIDQLYAVLESVLEVKGFGTISTGPITKIVPLGTVKQRGIEVTGSGAYGLGTRP
jgi:type II secretory pathway component GspD/PulD (secretin)